MLNSIHFSQKTRPAVAYGVDDMNIPSMHPAAGRRMGSTGFHLPKTHCLKDLVPCPNDSSKSCAVYKLFLPWWDWLYLSTHTQLFVLLFDNLGAMTLKQNNLGGKRQSIACFKITLFPNWSKRLISLIF